jgi:hypothetical protein
VGVLTSASFEPGLVDVLQGVQVARLPSEQTTRFVNIYRCGIRQQRIEAHAEPLGAQHLLPEWRDTPIVHLAPIADELTPRMADEFPAALVGVTPQGWMRAWDKEGNIRPIPWPDAETILKRADAVIFSEQDVPNTALVEQYAKHARLLVLTRSQRGCTVYWHGEQRHIAAFRSRRQSDPTGAGDVFAAAYLVYLSQSADPFASAKFANCVASFAVERRYFRGIPTLAQVEQRWREGKRRRVFGPT